MILKEGTFNWWAHKLAYCAARLILERGGEMYASDVRREIEGKLKSGKLRLRKDFLEEVEAKSGKCYPRWHEQLSRYTSDYAMVGFMEKGGGRWRLTPSGKKLLSEADEETVTDEVVRKYREYLRRKRANRKEKR